MRPSESLRELRQFRDGVRATQLREINETLALSYPATTVEGALEAAHKIGYPVLVRAAFTLGGLGSGFAENDAELR